MITPVVAHERGEEIEVESHPFVVVVAVDVQVVDLDAVGDEDFLVRGLRQAEDDLDVRKAGPKPGIRGGPGRRAPDLPLLGRHGVGPVDEDRPARLEREVALRLAHHARDEAAARAEADTHRRAEGVGQRVIEHPGAELLCAGLRAVARAPLIGPGQLRRRERMIEETGRLRPFHPDQVPSRSAASAVPASASSSSAKFVTSSRREAGFCLTLRMRSVAAARAASGRPRNSSRRVRSPPATSRSYETRRNGSSRRFEDVLYLVVVTLVLGDALAQGGHVDVDARPLGGEVLLAVHLPLVGLLRDSLRDERPDPVLAPEHDLAHSGVAQDRVEDRLVLPVRHLEPDVRVSEVGRPDALEERERVAIPLLDPAEVERAVAKLERVEGAVGG